MHDNFVHVLGLSPKERINFMEHPRWIPYPKATHLLDSLRHLMEVPKKPRMPNLLVVGDPNNGKTTIIERFKKQHGIAYVDDEKGAVIPAIVAQSPPSADEKGLYISILEQFFTPYRATDSCTKLRYQVIHQFRNCNVSILIIDEFHSLLTGSAVKQREVMNTIKLLCNELLIPIVGVGTRDAVRVLHTDPQHASRFDVFPLSTWELDKEFQQLLAGFEKALPLKKPSMLHKPELATLLHAISGGNLGNLHELLVRCATEAIESEKEYIDKAIIEKYSWVRPTHGIREIRL